MHTCSAIINIYICTHVLLLCVYVGTLSLGMSFSANEVNVDMFVSYTLISLFYISLLPLLYPRPPAASLLHLSSSQYNGAHGEFGHDQLWWRGKPPSIHHMETDYSWLRFTLCWPSGESDTRYTCICLWLLPSNLWCATGGRRLLFLCPQFYTRRRDF